MQQYVCEWSGFAGAPGYSTFYGTDADGMPAALQAFFDTMKTWLPLGAKVQVPGVGDKINPTTGEITGSWSESVPAVVVGTNTAAYAAPVGVHFNWITDTFIGGRRLRGKTYIVPVTSALYDTDGSLTPTAVTQLAAVGEAFLADIGEQFMVWHRPTEEAPNSGIAGSVKGFNTRDRTSVLRSRRPK